MEITRVLIVDDEEQVRRSLVRLLERQGHSCAAAADAKEAAAALKEREFELVLCDVKMPGESGLELASGILAQFPDTAVVMVTAVDDPALASIAIDAGAYGYIVKPFTRNEVLINVANALRRRRLELDNRTHREQLAETIRERTAELWNTVRRLDKADTQLRSAFEEMIRRLSLAAELHDEETARHIERMSRYSALLARRAGLDSERCEQILLASRLHDVGKIGVADRILRKRGKFTPEEFEVMKRHAEVGHDLFADTDAELLQLSGTIAWTHHERWDGSGYPRGLSGEAIPVEGRIAAVGDVFDALLSKRLYKPPMPLGQAVDVMREGRGKHFDPALLDVFLGLLDEVLAITEKYADRQSNLGRGGVPWKRFFA